MNGLVLFFKEAWGELKQVTWLTTPQMIASTWVVIILVIIMAIYVFAVDFILRGVFGALIG
jgi:preprotein translocase SecE subunit